MWGNRWLDVAPSTHRFDYTIVEPTIADVVRTNRDRGQILNEIDRLLVATFGTWVTGWTWAVSNGGPVRPFCCNSHSILPDRELGEPEATIARVAASVLDYRDFLETLDRMYADIHALGLPPLESVERAAPLIFAFVAERTHGEDAWYATFHIALQWFVETVVYDVEKARLLVEQVVETHFSSWTLPTSEVRDATLAEIATQLVTGEVFEPANVVDGLEAWLAIRPSAFAHVALLPAHRPVDDDGHERFIATIDHARDPARAERMRSALVLCRDAARHDLPLAFDQLAEWQALVLGENTPTPFRTTDAFAKQGRERYPFDDTTAARFERALADANDPRTPVAVRAATAYLDVCFFHPFPDGNGRAARLALDHVLTRAGLVLHDPRGLFTLSRAAGDGAGAAAFAAAIDRLVGPRAR